MSNKRHKQSSWSIWTSVIPQSSAASDLDDILRLEKPEFVTYCRVCLRGLGGHEYQVEPKDSHPYDPKTMMKTHAFRPSVEVDPSVQAKREADAKSD